MQKLFDVHLFLTGGLLICYCAVPTSLWVCDRPVLYAAANLRRQNFWLDWTYDILTLYGINACYVRALPLGPAHILRTAVPLSPHPPPLLCRNCTERRGGCTYRFFSMGVPSTTKQVCIFLWNENICFLLHIMNGMGPAAQTHHLERLQILYCISVSFKWMWLSFNIFTVNRLEWCCVW